MKKITIIFSIIILSSLTVLAQDFIMQNGEKINQIDKNGLRQGVWNFYDSKSTMKVSIRITNDIPSDTIFYFQNEELKFMYVKSQPDSNKYFINGKGIKCEGYYTNDNPTYCKGDSISKEKIKSFLMFEIFPTYYGGQTAMTEYFKGKIINGPKNEKGKVKVGFTLDKAGRPTDIKINESENEKLNDYCIDVIKKMPRWQPGYQGGAIVTVPLVLPLIFK